MVSETGSVSLIATVLNERAQLAEWLDGLESQSRPPDEIVIVDGGSTDGTYEALCAWRAPVALRVLRLPGATIAAGRNAAIAAARGDVIAVTDAGAVADPDWLAALIAAFDTRDIDVAAGFFVPATTSRWERALAATTLPDVTEIVPERFLPSSRSVAFRRRWFEVGARYPAWLDYSEDLVWDMTLARAGARFAFVPDAVVRFRVRPTPRAHVAQYRRYARGDGKAGLFARRHAARYATYCAALAVLARRRPGELGVGLMLGAIYIRRPAQRLWRRDRAEQLPVSDTLATALLLPWLRLLGDLAKMTGYPIGLWWRWRRLGGLGPRTSWRRITPDGRLWRPAARSRGTRRPTTSRGA